MIKIFIGFDYRETVAYHVCSNSIIRHSTAPLSITPLALNTLGDYKEQHRDGSNDFIYSRFLVPHYCDYQGWAIFIDGDMVVREDISKLWEMRDEQYAVQVVKHDYTPRSSKKYLGSKNEKYPRKNWSSVVLWNCGHPSNQKLTLKKVTRSSGSTLHRFTWLDDEEIGELPIEWNWLVDEFGENNRAKLLHYTLGTPCFDDYKDTTMASVWHREKELTNYASQNDTE